ncbi:MAG TPA: sulfotransferase domain-containing protein, partial [Planctomycetota bacterium]|nr:sulfotransferase domain-containing protein [Planctomycetota bacterium]
MSGIIWLGSYPRSGNTWFRILLEHLLADASAPFDPRRPRVRNAAARELIDSALGIETSDLTHDEVDRLRPLAYERIARESRDEPLFLKTHDAWVEGADGRITLSRSATRGAIYLIRDPRDVAVSLAFHLGCDLDDAIHRLTSADDALARHTSRGNVQTRQKLLGWSGHVESWTGPRGPSPYVVRYEDLVSAPEETFAHALLACGIDVSASQVEAAVDATRFEKLRAI